MQTLIHDSNNKHKTLKKEWVEMKTVKYPGINKTQILNENAQQDEIKREE